MSNKATDNFPFIRFPRALIDNPNFSEITAEAKMLFTLILDRMGVSQINADRFTDSNGNLFVFYTIQEICNKLGCSHGKAVRLINELEFYGLIFKQRLGCGKPNKIIILPSVLGILKMVKEIILIMADVMSGTSSTVRIGGSDFPRNVVISRYRKLTAEHIEYIIGCIESGGTQIKNIKSYLISALFNAPTTMANSVSAEFAYHQKTS